MQSTTSEKTIQQSIQLVLSKQGYVVFRLQSGTFLTLDGQRHVVIGVPGMSDLLAVGRDGRAAWIETKRSRSANKRKDQIAFVDAMRRMGCRAGFASSIEEALEIVGI